MGCIRKSQRVDDLGPGAARTQRQPGNDAGVKAVNASESWAHGLAKAAVVHDRRKSRLDPGNQSYCTLL